MSRKIEVEFNENPIVKVRVIDKNDSVLVTKSKTKYPFILCNDVRVSIFEKDKVDITFLIKKDYVWNGADIPKILFIFGQSKDNNYLVASMVHDFMLEKKGYIYCDILKRSISVNEYRKLTSLIFRQILKDEKTNTIKANCMSFGVDVYQKFFNTKMWKELREE